MRVGKLKIVPKLLLAISWSVCGLAKTKTPIDRVVRFRGSCHLLCGAEYARCRNVCVYNCVHICHTWTYYYNGMGIDCGRQYQDATDKSDEIKWQFFFPEQYGAPGQKVIKCFPTTTTSAPTSATATCTHFFPPTLCPQLVTKHTATITFRAMVCG